MRISDWSSDVCSSDLCWLLAAPLAARRAAGSTVYAVTDRRLLILEGWPTVRQRAFAPAELDDIMVSPAARGRASVVFIHRKLPWWRRSRSEEHTSELQSLMRISYAVFCLKKKK